MKIKRYFVIGLFLGIFFFGCVDIVFCLTITDNWEYTKRQIDHENNDYDGSIDDLIFTNYFNRTSATAHGWVWAEDEIDGDSWAKGYMNFSFGFRLNYSSYIWLADDFSGSLSLGDDDNNNYAYAETYAKIYDVSGSIVASLPDRNERKTEQGSWPYNDSEEFFDHLFSLSPGNYYYKASLEIGAGVDDVSIFDLWDDRMRSDFTYKVEMKWTTIPEPSTLSLFLIGILGILGRHFFDRKLLLSQKKCI